MAMSNEGTSAERPLDSQALRPRLGGAKGRFEVPDFDEPLPPQVQASFEGESFTPASIREARRRAIDLAEAGVRLSGSTLPPEIEEVNRRFVDGEFSAEEHLVVVLRLAAAFARMAGERRGPGGCPVLASQVGDGMLRAVRDVCDGRGAQPQADSRDDLDIPEHLQQLAGAILGPEDSRRWWAEPAFGLGWQRPLDVMAQPSGPSVVEGLLRRIDACVYT